MVELSRVLKALSPALAVFAATVAISVATGHPPDLFDANSTGSIVRRSLLISAILVGVVPFAPRITATLAFFMRDKTPIGQLMKTDQPRETELQRLMSWFLRPIQGIGLSMIAGESLIELLEYGTGTGYSEAIARVAYSYSEASLWRCYYPSCGRLTTWGSSSTSRTATRARRGTRSVL